MQRLEVRGAVRPTYGSLGVKRLKYFGVAKVKVLCYKSEGRWLLLRVSWLLVTFYLVACKIGFVGACVRACVHVYIK